jgi:hypothetical protein
MKDVIKIIKKFKDRFPDRAVSLNEGEIQILNPCIPGSLSRQTRNVIPTSDELLT